MFRLCQLLVTAFFVLGQFVQQAASSEIVELELVLALDTSTSVDAREFELQRTGLARAFRSQSVQSAIASLGKAGMAVSVVQWSGPSKQNVAVDWFHIASARDAEKFAGRLANMPRQLRGFTDIAGALAFSRRHILTNNFQGARLAIDVSGDGTSDENDPSDERNKTLEQGITINGLVIFSEEFDLGDLAEIGLLKHYTQKVVGGPGHFVIQAKRFENFAEAIQKKLVREIIGPAFADLR